MSMLDWAFEQDLPTAEKLVLVRIASQASCNGVAPQDREALMQFTGYKKRSIQRLLRSLNKSGHLQQSGDYFIIGAAGPVNELAAESAEDLPTGNPLRYGTASADGLQIMVDTDAIAQAVGDYVIDQFANFEKRISEQLERFVLFHVEQGDTDLDPPLPDPVIDNPLYEQLIDSGMSRPRAYALSQADLEMGVELDNETLGLIDGEFVGIGGDDEYQDTAMGRFERILDILHGATSDKLDTTELRSAWALIELQENKHTVKGEQDAFVLLYPQIVAAAKANVGKLTIHEFCDTKRAARSDAPWHHELKPADKEDPALEIEIGTMLAAIEATGNQQCQVRPRTTEKGDDGSVVQETLAGFHRRVTAKYNQMHQLKEMGLL